MAEPNGAWSVAKALNAGWVRPFLFLIFFVVAGDLTILAIHDGDLVTGSLTSPGFASSVHPDWSAMLPLQRPSARILQEKV